MRSHSGFGVSVVSVRSGLVIGNEDDSARTCFTNFLTRPSVLTFGGVSPVVRSWAQSERSLFFIIDLIKEQFR